MTTKQEVVFKDKATIFYWPESQGCIGCDYARLIDDPDNPSTYICLLCNQENKTCNTSNNERELDA